MYASRNISLCTKDCLCLFVCPTGATDTETGQIDRDTCIDGCRACVDACPSHAIHLVFEEYPEPKAKDPSVSEALMSLGAGKIEQEGLARGLSEDDGNPGAARLARALARSSRILAEDGVREAGFLTPQCRASKAYLAELAESAEGGDRDTLRALSAD